MESLKLFSILYQQSWDPNQSIMGCKRQIAVRHRGQEYNVYTIASYRLVVGTVQIHQYVENF